jgi:hypothetical protein
LLYSFVKCLKTNIHIMMHTVKPKWQNNGKKMQCNIIIA